MKKTRWFIGLLTMMIFLIPACGFANPKGEWGASASIPTGNLSKPERTRETNIKFTDVKENSWYDDAVSYVVAEGLLKGTGETTFSPNQPMSRAMFVTALSRFQLKLHPGDEIKGNCSFSDVKATTYYADAVCWAAQKGIVKGDQGTFHPDQSISRQELVTMLYRYAQYIGCDVGADGGMILQEYSDGQQVDSFAAPAMRWALQQGILKGSGKVAAAGETLSPKAMANRAETAQILANFSNYVFRVDN